MASHSADEPVFMIGVVVSLTGMHAQTIRLYERLGLVAPQRRNRNRLYSEADVERLRRIRSFTQDMGVNLAGVEVILDLLRRLDELQADRDYLAERSAAIERHFRDYLARTGDAFPPLDVPDARAAGRAAPSMLPAGAARQPRQIPKPPIVTPPRRPHR